MRALGVDLGDARTGLALSDALGMLASGLETIQSTGLKKTAAAVLRAAKDHAVTHIVVGLPRNMDGSCGERAEKCRQFAERLRGQTTAEVVLWDERVTTVSAHRILNETNTRGEKRKAVVDQVAASIILQSWLDAQKGGSRL